MMTLCRKPNRPRGAAFPAAALGLAFLAALAASPSAWAARPVSGNEVGVGPKEVVRDDLYIAGNTVTIDGTVTGDVVAAAQRVVLNGRVGGDFMAVAQTVVVNGEVGDDIRVGAQAVQLTGKAQVGSDVLSGVYSFEQQAGSHIGRDLLLGGYQGRIAGDVGRDIRVAANRLELSGKVGGNVFAGVGGEKEEAGGPPPGTFMASAGISLPSVPPGLTLTSGARLGGKLVYTSEQKANIASGATIAQGVTHKVPRPSREEREKRPTAASWVLNQLRRLVALVIVGLLMVWLVPGWTRAVGDAVKARPLPSFGWGFVASFIFIAAVLGIFTIMVVLAVLFGLLTIGGILGLVLALGIVAEMLLFFGFALFVAFGAPVIISSLGGRLVFQRVRDDLADNLLVSFLAGVVVLWLLTAIPVVGLLVSLLVTLFGLGGLWLWATELMSGQPVPSRPPLTENAE